MSTVNTTTLPGEAVTKEPPAVPAARPGEGSGRGTASMITVPPQTARKADLRCRVLVDPRVWDDCVAWTEQDSARTGLALDEAVRLDEVLYLAACALRRDSAEGSGTGRPGDLRFDVERVPRTGPGREVRKVTLTVTAARGSRGITVTIAPANPGLGSAR